VSGDKKWIVVRTQPRRETVAVEWINRQNQGCESYLPRYFDPRNDQVKLLLPSYLFVLTPGAWYFLKGTYGVSSVLMQGDQPQVVLDREIAILRGKEDRKGIIHLKDLELKLGDKVTINWGALKGQVGEYDGNVSSERIRIVLNFFGVVTLDRRHITVND
jgi:transcriptional antiterminator RfaH